MTRKKTVFQPGDRVAERPKNMIFSGLSAKARQTAAANNQQRYGTVTGLTTKVTSTRQVTKYVLALIINCLSKIFPFFSEKSKNVQIMFFFLLLLLLLCLTIFCRKALIYYFSFRFL